MGGGPGGPKTPEISNRLFYLAAIIFFMTLLNRQPEQEYEDVTFDCFENEYLKKGQIKQLSIVRTLIKEQPKTAIIFTANDSRHTFRTEIANVDHFLLKLEELQKSNKIPEKDWIKVTFSH